MSGYALTPLAKADVFQIWSYIAKDNVDAAERVEQAIHDACASLAEAPSLGHARQDFTDRTLRFWTLVRYPNYTVVYRPEKKPLPGCRCSSREKKYPPRVEETSISVRTVPSAQSGCSDKTSRLKADLADPRVKSAGLDPELAAGFEDFAPDPSGLGRSDVNFKSVFARVAVRAILAAVPESLTNSSEFRSA